MTDEEAFEANRELLFAVAYRMLGTVADAEDAVQDTWLRWSAAPRPDVTQPRAYLVKTVTHLALNRLRSARARREAYVGPWLPEPLLIATPDAAGRAELAESVSLAMLVVLESLTPEERAVFVLHEVFGFTHAEIAAAIGHTGASVRQLMHRAREHVQARRPRFDVDAGQQREVTKRFLAAAAGGDIDQLLMVLAPDVTLIADGGGKAKAPLRPITGAAKVARFIAGVSRRPYGGADVSDMVVETVEINGGPGTVITAGGKPIAAVTTVITDGRISAIHLIANPDKLQGLGAGRTLSR
ncbi:MAG TPA: RNA polymerase sigma-70 factor [Streptosporangiaceae bacterium]|nr:RNA polymerase sigma-70 factor [Streptosporangiaceae bacterium]